MRVLLLNIACVQNFRRGPIALALATLFLFSPDSFADQYFQPSRNDQTVPRHCFDVGIKDFDEPFENITVGVMGAQAKSFTYEVAIRREQAEILWRVFRARVRGSRDHSAENQLSRDHQIHDEASIIEANYRQMGFSFNNEGDVLELLSIVYLMQAYPRTHFFHTGGYVYGARGRALGELDVMVGRIHDCQIVLVGQAKLGLGSARNAWEQINRFQGFVRDILGRSSLSSF